MSKVKGFLAVGFLFLGLAKLSAQAESNFQTRKISISESSIKLGDALLQIAEKAEFNLSFNPSILKADSQLNLAFKQKTAAFIYEQILPSTVAVRELGNSIILQEKSEVNKTEITIEGKVLSSNNQPINQALIFEISGLASDLSDKNGYFKLEVEAGKFKDVRLSVAKKSYQDSMVILPVENQNIEITLSPLSPQEIEGKPQTIARKGFQDFSYSRVLVPKKVQLRTELAPITMYREFQFSIFPGLSTNQKMSGKVENKYSFNLIGGYNYGTHALEMGTAFNIDRKFLKGWQLAGGFNFVGGTVEGIQLAGGANIVGEKMEGVQASGGINFVYGDQVGIQLSGGANINLGYTEGIQVSGGTNINLGKTEGIQITGGANINFEKTEGVQLSGGYNQAKDLNGAQISGGLNAVLGTSDGLQVAPVNYATLLKGKQIGVVNVADSASGFPIGLVSFVRKAGYQQLEISADELSYGNVNLKMGVPKLYNIYSAGMGYHQDGFLWNYGLGMGTEKRTANNRLLNYELKFHWLYKEVKNSYDHYGLIKWQFLMQNKADHKLRVSYGPSINLMGFKHELTESSNYESIPPYTFLDEKVQDLQLQSWIGFSVSIGLRDFF
ncbi:MAG: hypothetical protein RIC95_11980 [Vicingaceae bacterium]